MSKISKSTYFEESILRLMNCAHHLAKHIRDLYFGQNWTSASMQDLTANLSWKMATYQFGECNSIAALVYHTNYYVKAIIKVLKGGPLDARDKYSFDLPSIVSQNDWEQLLKQSWTDADVLASLVEVLSDESLQDDFSDGKYGSCHRNILGVIEHTHYHLGQIAILKKIISTQIEKSL